MTIDEMVQEITVVVEVNCLGQDDQCGSPVCVLPKSGDYFAAAPGV